ncbi:NUDIX domain-containing protein [Streptomyces sp. NPDC018019]|uniref:NUDIX domain-containing protein n=1 Tax=Streptomyces sp. NPDC018019 TaxID=3365030 RepID=UPI0037963F92
METLVNSPDTTDHFTDAPPRRIGSQGLIRSEKGDILLFELRRRVDRGDLLTWNLPGGCAQGNEDPQAACKRRIQEKSGLLIEPGRLLLMHWQPAKGNTLEGHNYVWDGGTISQHTEVRLAADITQYRFVPRKHLTGYAPESLVERINAAFRALGHAHNGYLAGRAG